MIRDETVVAEVVRGGLVESRHRGSVIALDGHTGRIFFSTGEVNRPMFPRSCAKPLQTLGMLRAGWRPGGSDEIAVASASHSGEPMHLDVVRRILAAVGLDESALDNTPDLPLDPTAAAALIRAGGGPDALHQNCSGKHAAMVATCVTAGWPSGGYRDPAHPLQQAIRATVEEVSGEKVAAVAVDGCGAPLFALSLAGVASAFARLTTAGTGTAEQRVADAMRRHPRLVGGTGRDVTLLMQAVDGLVAKDGAEGVYAAALHDGRAVALKIEDGAGRARAPVMVAALRRLGVTAMMPETLSHPPVLGHGEQVGVIRPVSI